MKSALALKVRSFSLAGVSIQFHITFAISSCIKREGWKQSSCSQEKCVCVRTCVGNGKRDQCITNYTVIHSTVCV